MKPSPFQHQSANLGSSPGLGIQSGLPECADLKKESRREKWATKLLCSGEFTFQSRPDWTGSVKDSLYWFLEWGWTLLCGYYYHCCPKTRWNATSGTPRSKHRCLYAWTWAHYPCSGQRQCLSALCHWQCLYSAGLNRKTGRGGVRWTVTVIGQNRRAQIHWAERQGMEISVQQRMWKATGFNRKGKGT